MMEQMMGKVVMVKAEYQVGYRDSPPFNKRKIKAVNLVTPRPGWIVGETVIQSGRKVWIGDEEGYAFDQQGPATPCLLIKYWPTLKAVRVPMDGVDNDCDEQPYYKQPRQRG